MAHLVSPLFLALLAFITTFVTALPQQPGLSLNHTLIYGLNTTTRRLVAPPGNPGMSGDPAVRISLESPAGETPTLNLFVPGFLWLNSPASTAAEYERVSVRVGCIASPSGGTDPSRFNFRANCNIGRNGLFAECSVPLRRLSYDQFGTTGCTSALSLRNCGPGADGGLRTLKIALAAVAKRYYNGRKWEVWALGDRCISDQGAVPTLEQPTCPAVGADAVGMSQEFEVPIGCWPDNRP